MGLQTTWIRLGAMAAAGLVLLMISKQYRNSTASLRQRESEALRDAGKLNERVADAERKIAEIRAEELDVARIRREIDQVQADLPKGSVTDSFPAWVKEHFARFGVVTPVVRCDAARNEPNASGYQRGSWSVDLSIDSAGLNIPRLLNAVSDIDQRNSFVRVLEFEIRPDPEKPGGRAGFLSLATVLRKQ